MIEEILPNQGVKLLICSGSSSKITLIPFDLSSLAISDYIIVTCDSTSMISEAAITGKPVYVAMMKPKRISNRFKSFFSQFNKLGITKELGESVDNWSYDKLDEINRIVPLIKQRMKQNGII